MNDSQPNKVKETIPIPIGVQLYNIHIPQIYYSHDRNLTGASRGGENDTSCLTVGQMHDIVADYQEV